jgi:hypothetical protein
MLRLKGGGHRQVWAFFVTTRPKKARADPDEAFAPLRHGAA